MAEDAASRPPPPPPAPAPDLDPAPLHFGRYEVPRLADGSPHRLGHGAMGVTYRAWDTRLRRFVALKVIDAALLSGGDPRARQRFFREASAAAQLHHPHIATIFDIGEQGGEDFYVMEFIDGENLLTRLKRDGPLDLPSVLQVGHQVAQALAAAWSRRIVHRDIKPANLMLARLEGTAGRGDAAPGIMVKVVDFGLAKALSVSMDSSAAISRTSAFFGTAAYASPEQIEATGELDVRSDLYSLGITLWHLLAGKPTFGNTSLRQAITGHLVRPPPFADLRDAGVPEPVIALLGNLLEKTREERAASAESVQEEIGRLLRDLAPAAPPPPAVGLTTSTGKIPSPPPPAGETTTPTIATAAGPPVAFFPLVEVLRRRGALPAAETCRLLGPLAVLVETPREEDGIPLPPPADAASFLVGFRPAPEGLGSLPGLPVEAWPPFTLLVAPASIRPASSAATVGEQTVVGTTGGPGGRHALLALGTLLYELLAGQPPMPGRNRPLSALDEAGNRALQRAFLPAAAGGFGTVAEFAEALRAAIAADPRPAARAVESRPVSPPPAADPPAGADPSPDRAAAPVPVPAGPPEPGRDHLAPAAGLDLIWVRPGAFVMGSPENPREEGRYEDETLHLVTLRDGFWLGRAPVTQGQYRAVTEANPSHFQHAGESAPVENVSWEEARAFCDRLTARERDAGRLPAGYVYGLPAESQWEYACRAGTATAVYTGGMKILGQANAPALDPIAWYAGNSAAEYEGAWDSSSWGEVQRAHRRAGTHPIGQKQPNAWGFQDMLGNVWEWCEDIYAPYGGSVGHPSSPGLAEVGGDDDDVNPARVLRGGAWSCGARHCRAAFRLGIASGFRGAFTGFRVALVPEG